MTVSEIETRARSLANLSSSKAISHDDVNSSANESWKDIYARLIERDDDYWVQTVTHTSISAYATTNPNEYLIPLPEDFYKLRAVDWQGSTWREMHKFPMSMREPNEPHYRFDSSNLWVVGANVTQVRIRYYPPPAVLTHPAPILHFGEALTPVVQSTIGLEKIFYISIEETMLYVLTNDIWSESLQLRSSTNLVTSVTPTRPTYYKGYLYFIEAGDIHRGIFNPSVPAAVVDAAITVLGTVVSFTILNDTIYFSTATQTFTCTLAGASITLLVSLAVDDVCFLGAGSTATLVGRVVATDTVISLTSPAIATNVEHLTSDGEFLYTVDTSNNLHKLTVAVVGTAVTVTEDNILHEGISYVGNAAGGYLSVLHFNGGQTTSVMHCHSTELDTDITYPSNALTELIAFQMAIDFKTKFGEDISALKLRLGDYNAQPPTGLWSSFYKLAKRDDYEPERIKNSRSTLGNW